MSTGEVSAGTAAIPRERLAEFLVEQGLLAAPAALGRVWRLGDGQSNLVFALDLGEGRAVVLRRPPPGPLPPTAHDVLREYRVIAALYGTAVPVPRPVLACADPSVIGAPFYLMERMAGDAIRRELPPALAEAPPAERRAIAEQAVDTLAALHGLDAPAVGLGDLGRPSGYMGRQLRRWRGQLDLARTRPLPDLDWVSDWLDAHLPAEEGPTAIVHGDYKLDNLLFAPEPPARLLAVVDWEMATLGDPLADLGWFLSYWREPGDPPPESARTSRVSELPGFPTRSELAGRYAARAGRDLPDFTFHLTFSRWKMAIIREGHYSRHVRGTAGDFDFAELEHTIPALAAAIRRSVAEEGG
jgi:aminoglycoside phosphotransferase (APT) family kinase protein